MKLMYIASVDFYTKPNPSFHLMESMITDILGKGIEVYYIGVREKGIEKHIPNNIKNNSNFTFDLINCLKIDKSSFVKRYLNGILYATNIGIYIKKNINDCDLVFIQSSPTVLYNILVTKKYAKKKKIIYNVQDMFPGSSIASGIMPQKWMQKIFFLLQKIAYKKSDVIVAISEDMKQKLIEQNVPKEKIRVIVNWFDDQSIHQVMWNENRFVKKYNLSKNKFYVQYAGTMGYVFDYRMVIAVAEKLKAYEDIIFQMIGDGSQKQDFINEVNRKNLTNIEFLPLESQEMVSDVYSACSICFIPLKKGVIGNSVPSKAGLLMACHRAIVTTVDEKSDYFNMINKNYIGIANACDDVNATADSILKLYSNRELCQQYGENGFLYGYNRYSRKKNMSDYLELFTELSGV